MPKFFDVVQNSPEWDTLRLGIATSSDFAKIITATGKLSAQADKFQHLLIAERMMQTQVREFQGNYWTERGHELEQDAREAYQIITDNKVTHAGFVTDDQIRFGCSPDGIIKSDNGGLEIKCPAPATHIDYLINKTFDSKYKPQYQGQMLIAQLDYVDFVSYHPDLPVAYFRIEPDLEYQKIMLDALNDFHEQLTAKIETLRSSGHIVPDKPIIAEPQDFTMAG